MVHEINLVGCDQHLFLMKKKKKTTEKYQRALHEVMAKQCFLKQHLYVKVYVCWLRSKNAFYTMSCLQKYLRAAEVENEKNILMI